MLDEKLASPEDIDTAVRLSIGPRLALWGPLLTEDLVVNKKTAMAVFDYLNKQPGGQHFASRPVSQNLVANGDLGAISGRGWYEFHKPYDDIVRIRDQQLSRLLGELTKMDAATEIGAGTVETATSESN